MLAESAQHLAISPADPAATVQIAAMVALWNETSGEELAISERLLEYNLRPPAGGAVMSWLATMDDRPAGFVIASHLAERPAVMLPTTGWVGAIAVAPGLQRHGIGAALMAEAEGWLSARGVTQVMLGGDIRPFMPGAPVGLQSTGFFLHQGYGVTINGEDRGMTWDVAADLSGYEPPASVVEVAGIVRPAQPGEERFLLDFMVREFPGRWHYETQEFIREGGRISDWMLLWTEQGVDGFCALTFEDSLRPIERYYPYQLPRPWGQLGPIGISASLRGQGYGAAVLNAGLRRLHDNGIKGCVIDWTRLVDFYAKFGFEKYHAYQQMFKSLS